MPATERSNLMSSNKDVDKDTSDKANAEDTEKDDDDEFTFKEIAPDVYLCREIYYTSWNVANLYVVRGTEADLIIDTGIGLWDFPAFLKAKGLIGGSPSGANGGEEKPHHAVATHIHFDHSGGLHQFQGSFAIHQSEANAIRTGDSYEAVCFISRAECGKPPTASWKPSDYRLRPGDPTRILEDGDVFDLGDKRLRVMHLPGHSRGSIALFDEQRGYFFSGDIIYDGPVLDWLPYGSVEDNIASYEAIEALAPRVKRVFPGHGDDFDGTKLKSIASMYLKNVGTCHDCTARIGKVLATVLLKGRNTKEKGPRCCFYSCCCCLCCPPIAD